MIDVESSTGTSPAPVMAERLGPGAGVDDDHRRADPPRPAGRRGDLDRLRPGEMGLAFDQVEPVLRQAARVVLPRAGDHGPFALAHRGQVHRYRTDAHAVLRAAARLVGQARAGDHRLGRGAPGVDAGAAELVHARRAPPSGPPSPARWEGTGRPGWSRSRSRRSAHRPLRLPPGPGECVGTSRV